MRTISLVILATIVATLSACTGMELGAKVGLYRVDERQESQATHNIPLKCYLWADCSTIQPK